MKYIVKGSFKKIRLIFNTTDDIAYLRSRDFLSLIEFPLLPIESLDLNSSRIVNIDVIINTTNGIRHASSIFKIICVAKKPIEVTSHIK